MTGIEALPFILFIVVIATAIAEKTNTPYPLLLVIAGLVVGFIPYVPDWHPPTDFILPLFLPPILFASARLVSWQDVKANLDTIGSLSILLVLVSSLAIAWALHHFVPQMSFSTALVLSSIIAPTDTVAANAILTRLNIRQQIIRTIEVESLFNDAMSIVLYNSAVSYVYIQSIQLSDLSWQLLLVGLGGIAVGFLFAHFTRLIVQQFLTESENNLSIVMGLILAYVAYLFADHAGVSGVLAVVTAGLYHKKTEQFINANTRLSEKAVWDTFIFFLNGVLFISIGMQFRSYLNKVNYLSWYDLMFFSLITIFSLILLRILWVAVTTYTPLLFKRQKEKNKLFALQKVVIVSWSGMRGLVSLALAMALPEVLSETKIFPYRNLILFLTIMTILFTLLVQGLTLPWFVRSLNAGKDDKDELRQISKIHKRLTHNVLKKMKTNNLHQESYSLEARKLVKNYYTNRLMQFAQVGETNKEVEAHEVGHEAAQFLSEILQYERKELLKMLNSKKISEEVYIRVLRKLDYDEVSFASYR